jgi:hypothetical protein
VPAGRPAALGGRGHRRRITWPRKPDRTSTADPTSRPDAEEPGRTRQPLLGGVTCLILVIDTSGTRRIALTVTSRRYPWATFPGTAAPTAATAAASTACVATAMSRLKETRSVNHHTARPAGRLRVNACAHTRRGWLVERAHLLSPQRGNRGRRRPRRTRYAGTSHSHPSGHDCSSHRRTRTMPARRPTARTPCHTLRRRWGSAHHSFTPEPGSTVERRPPHGCGRPSCRHCWTNPASARSAPPTCSSRGPTPAGAARKPRSLPWPASAPWKHPPDASNGTGSTASATAPSTGHHRELAHDPPPPAHPGLRPQRWCTTSLVMGVS